MYGKIYKGLKELTELGLIEEKNTRMSGCQADGCSPIITAWKNNTLTFRPVRPNTIAKSLAIGNPADGYYTLKIMQDTNGAGASVSDPEVVEGIKLLAETEGIFAETAGGVTIGCLKKMVESGFIKREEETVAVISGGGLKTIEAVVDEVEEPLHVQPTVESFIEARRARSGVAVTV